MDDTQIKEAAEKLKTEAKATAETAGKEAAAEAVKEVKTTADEAKATAEWAKGEIDKLALVVARKASTTDEDGPSPLVAAIQAKSEAIKNRGRNQEVRIPLGQKAVVDMTRANSGAATSQSLISSRGYVALPNSPTHVRDFMRLIPLSTPYLKYDRELTPQGAPAMTAEGTKKPQISFLTETVTATAEKIAAFYKLSTETVHDAPAFAGSLQGRGIEMTLTEEDGQLIYGTGASGQIQGIYPLAVTFDPGDIYVPSAQWMDVLRIAAAQVRRSYYRANAILMNPDDVASLELTKDSEGRYMLPTLLTNSLPAIGRVQIIELDAMNPGEFLAGAFDMGVETYVVESLSVKVYDQNEDDAVKNKVTTVIEERLLQAVLRPSAFVKGTFVAAVAAIDANAPV